MKVNNLQIYKYVKKTKKKQLNDQFGLRKRFLLLFHVSLLITIIPPCFHFVSSVFGEV